MDGPARSRVEVRRLRALEAIVRLGSVSAAARELGYTQSAASQQLAALEREVGMVLVERARPVRPTEAGAVLLEHGREVLGRLAAAEAALDELHGLRAGRLRLVAFGSAAATFVPEAVAEMARRHPALEVDVAVAEPPAALDALRAGAADLALVHEPSDAPLVDDPELRRRELAADPLRLVLFRGHRLARRRRVPVTALAGEPLLVPRAEGPGGGHRRLVERICADAGVVPSVRYEVDDLRAAQAFAAAGLAVALMHALTVDPGREPAVRPLAGAETGTRRIVARWPARRRWPPTRAMLAILDERVGA